MRLKPRLWWSGTLGLCLAAALLFGPAHAEEGDAAEAVDPIAAATEIIKKARTVKQGDGDVKKQLKALLDTHRDAAKAVVTAYAAPKGSGIETPRGAGRLASMWNELLTVSHYHGLKPKDRYALRPFLQVRGARFGVPYSGLWTPGRGDGDQLATQIYRKTPDGDTVRHIKVWAYRWDTIYSGVGGENYKKLAKEMHELDRDSMSKKGRKASTKVQTKRLNKEITRSYYYYVQGFDVDLEKTIRRRNYYIKGKNITLNFEVIDMFDPEEGEDPVTQWVRTQEDPETAPLLATISFPD